MASSPRSETWEHVPHGPRAALLLYQKEGDQVGARLVREGKLRTVHALAWSWGQHVRSDGATLRALLDRQSTEIHRRLIGSRWSEENAGLRATAAEETLWGETIGLRILEHDPSTQNKGLLLAVLFQHFPRMFRKVMARDDLFVRALQIRDRSMFTVRYQLQWMHSGARIPKPEMKQFLESEAASRRSVRHRLPRLWALKNRADLSPENRTRLEALLGDAVYSKEELKQLNVSLFRVGHYPWLPE